ncbi:MAG TPA: hypothetical protein VL977_01840, partial [Solirubrobacteraceae bacterium]|nr:hypothetical protein [Solirubrobacteraceae bacterium]
MGRRFLFYNDGLGLGHRSRNLKIASELVRALPGASVLAMMPGARDLEQALAPGVELFELPPIAMAGYNTVTEALRAGLRLIVMPRPWHTIWQAVQVAELTASGAQPPPRPALTEQRARAA